MDGLKCEACGRVYIPPKLLCSECSGDRLIAATLTGKGEVYSYTTIRVPPLGFEEQAPFDLLLVRLEEGINVTARVTKGKNEGLTVGDKVVFDKKENGIFYFSIVS